MSFYNTTHEKGRVLVKLCEQSESQEQKVLDIFRRSKTGLTASEVFKQYPEKNVPLTSIRRAITNLMQLERKLIKTTNKRAGIYGKPETEYQLYTGQMTLFN